jgi:hypothetical protein
MCIWVDRRNHLLVVAMGQPISINQQLGPRRADVAFLGHSMVKV